MMSIQRQCTEVTTLLAALQGCVDRQGHVIPCRADDFAVYVARARAAMGVSGGAPAATAARHLYKKRPATPASSSDDFTFGAEATSSWYKP